MTSQRPLSVLSLGLFAGSLAAALRGVLHRAAAVDRAGDSSEILSWSASAAVDSAVPMALIVGAALGLAAVAVNSKGGAKFVTIVGAAALTLIAYGILDAPARRTSGVLFAGSALVVCIAAGAVVGLRDKKLPSALLLLVLAAAPILGARYLLGSNAPTFVLTQTMHDFLADPNSWRVLESREDHTPAMRVITPAVAAHKDSADKPCLWMAPPCSVELHVPAGLPDGFLRLSAGIDKHTRVRLPQGVGDITVHFEAVQNGETVWAERIYNGRPKAGQWESDDWTWRHSPADALPVKGGDTIVLRTFLPDGHPAAAMPSQDLVVGFGGLTVEAQLDTDRTRATAESPNLVLVVQDTLRADRCSTYGYERETTPHLTQLAERGTVFDVAHSTSSWTWPSTASLLTGLDPDAHGVVSNQSCTLNRSLDSVAEVLQARGYTTAAWSCNPLIVPERYFDQGFEFFDSHRTDFRKGGEVWPEIDAWLEEHAGTKFFLYLHWADPHTPHRPSDENRDLFGAHAPEGWPEKGLVHVELMIREQGIDNVAQPLLDHAQHLYDASVRTGDDALGMLMERLEDLGIDDETVVMFTADHGEELLEHGKIGHGFSLFSEVVNVPLVMAGPGLPEGARRNEPVSNQFVASTLARLGGGELKAAGDTWLLSETFPDPLFSTTKAVIGKRVYQNLYGLNQDGFVMHWWQEQPETAWLYEDEAQQVNVADQHPDRVLHMREEIEKRLKVQREWAPRFRVGVGAAGTEMLQGIGYLGDEEEDDEE